MTSQLLDGKCSKVAKKLKYPYPKYKQGPVFFLWPKSEGYILGRNQGETIPQRGKELYGTVLVYKSNQYVVSFAKPMRRVLKKYNTRAGQE